MDPTGWAKIRGMKTSNSWRKMVRVVTLEEKGRLKPKGLLMSNQTALESD